MHDVEAKPRSHFVKSWLRRAAGEAARGGVWALFDQAVVSGTRFLTSVILARFGDPDEYGAFVVSFAVLLCANSFHQAVGAGPMAVLGASRTGSELRSYVTTVALSQSLAALLFVLFVAGFTGICFFLDAADELTGAFLGMAVALFFVQTQTFQRRVLFMSLKPQRALLNDVVYCGLQLAGLAVLWRMQDVGVAAPRVWVTSQNVFLTLAASGAVAISLGTYQIRGFLCWPPSGARGFLRENWHFGKWQLLGTGGTTLAGQAYTLLLSMLGGLKAAAALGACVAVANLTNPFIIGMGNILTPRAARVYALRGWSALLQLISACLVIVAVAMGSLVAATGVYGAEILNLLYDGKYTEYWGVLFLLAVSATFNASGTPLNAMLCAMRRPELVFYSQIFGSVIGVFLLVPSVHFWDVYGVATAFCIATLGGLGIRAGCVLKARPDYVREPRSSPDSGRTM